MFILRWAITVCRVWGIPIRLHLSMLIPIGIIVALSLKDMAILIFGISLLVGVFGSVLLHELGHCFVAIRKGCRVREILLTPIGGIAQMESIPRRPGDEILMALAGPIVSIVISGVCFLLSPYAQAVPLLSVGRSNLLDFLARVNCFLALFNLLPAFPMDGGRVLRGALSPRIGRLRATYIASRLGQIIAIIFAVVALCGGLSLFIGSWFQRGVLVFIAFFIYRAAGAEYRMVEFQETYAPFSSGPIWDIRPGDPAQSKPGEVIVTPPPRPKNTDGTIGKT